MKTTLKYELPLVLLTAGFLTALASASEPATLPVAITVPANATSREIQQALDSLPDTGGEVILQTGIYAVSQPVVLRRSSQTLRGSGSSTVLRLADLANCPVLILGEPVNSPSRTVSGLAVADLAIDGNRSQQQFEIWQPPKGDSEIRNNGITVQGVTDSKIERVSAGHCRSGGLVTTYYVRRLVVREFAAFDSEFDGLACYRTEDSLFVDLDLHDNQAAGISFDLAVNHNIIRNASLAGNDLGIFMRDARYNLFHQVQVRRCRNYGVFMAQSEAWTPAGWRLLAHSECTNNSFHDLRVSQCGGAAVRVNNASCVDNKILGGRFLDNPQGGVSQVSPNLVTEQLTVQP